MPTLKAADNPELAAQLINEAISNATEEEPAAPADTEIEYPLDTVFQLPGGYVGPDGFEATDFEVRELTGRDEEAMARAKTSSVLLDTILKRGLVRVGEQEPNDTILNNLLAGDRDYIVLCIFAATFGQTVSSRRRCPGCQRDIDFEIDILKDVPVHRLESPADRYFKVSCSKGEAKVMLPTGITQKKIQDADSKTLPELSTILLANTVMSVGSRDIYSEADVLALPIRDRRKIADAIADRAPGPKMSETKAACECGQEEVEVPLSLGSLFQ